MESENESLSACLDSMVDKLGFCTWAEVTSQVVGSDLSNQRKTDVLPSRLIEQNLSLSTLTNHQIIRRTSKRMPSPAFPTRLHQNAQQTF